MKRIRVTVTQEDIDNGSRCAGSSCPVARAVRRHPEFRTAHVGLHTWWPDADEMRVTEGVPLTRAMSRFIERFDNEYPVEPATFLLPVPW